MIVSNKLGIPFLEIDPLHFDCTGQGPKHTSFQNEPSYQTFNHTLPDNF